MREVVEGQNLAETPLGNYNRVFKGLEWKILSLSIEVPTILRNG